MQRKYAALVPLVFVLVSATASAQEKGRVGLNFGYPTIGLTWHLSEKVAVRPEFTFSFASNDTTSGSGVEGTDQDLWGAGFGASVLFYFADLDGVGVYLAPRFTYVRSNVDATSSVSGTRYGDWSTAWDLAAMLGAQFAVNPRFSVFGEAGFAYNDRHVDRQASETLELKTDAWMVAPRGAVGVILYF